MPAKKNKGSKLANMSEEERARYMQHRAELELEAKRRKQQLIADFAKNKLKREEAFARLNTAKINEQWRFILRQIKCKELHEDLDYLCKNFDRTVHAKDAVIHKLYEELELADLDHRRLQEAHIEIIDEIIGRHRKRLETMHDRFLCIVREIEFTEIDDLSNLKEKLGNDCKYLETVIFAQAQYVENKLMKIRARNATSIHEIDLLKDEEISSIKRRVGSQMEELWRQLDGVISEYKSSTESKRKQYEYLKEQDDTLRSIAAQFPRLQCQLQSTIENLKDNYQKLSSERCGRLEVLQAQAEQLNEEMWKSRQEVRLNQNLDATRLKTFSVLSGCVIKDLKRIYEKASTLLQLIKMCSGLEPTAVILKKYAIHNAETAQETTIAPSVISPYEKLEKFWEQFNHVKAENIQKKRERDQLLLENKRLRHALRTYLMSVSRDPETGRPQTSI